MNWAKIAGVNRADQHLSNLGQRVGPRANLGPWGGGSTTFENQMKRARAVLGVLSVLVVGACSSQQSGGQASGGRAGFGGDQASAGAPASSGGATGGDSVGGMGGAKAAGGSPNGAGASSGGAAAAAGAGAVTWSEHVAPIAFRECVSCHREGGIGPFSLTSYASAAPFAGALADAVESRTMPPMPVNDDGSCNTYSNARWLSTAEIELFRSWATAGAPEGDPSRAPMLPSAPHGLENPSATLDFGADYTPSSVRPDDYRCFIVDAGLKQDTFLVGYEVLPGDAREVHHAIVYQPNTEADAAAAVQLDDAESGLGYTCFGGPRVDADPRVLWAPGGGVVSLPTGTGLSLVAGRKLILQVHYNLAAGAFPDRTRVRLATSNDVSKQATYLAVADTKMKVAAGQAAGVTTRTLDGTGTPLKIYGVLPHMHTLGLALHVEAATASAKRCLVDVDRWDFHWQNAWWYDEPLTLDLFKSVSISCTYDTRGRTAPVTWGEGTSDEMCLSYLYATAP